MKRWLLILVSAETAFCLGRPCFIFPGVQGFPCRTLLYPGISPVTLRMSLPLHLLQIVSSSSEAW